MRVVAAFAALSSGCILPVSTGAPMPATTVGRGNFGWSASAEAPVLDLIAGDKDSPSAVDYGAAPAAAMSVTVGYGLTDDTDVELAGEGALYYFILPLPTGGSLGLRQHFSASNSIDLAIAARVGHVGSTSESTDSNGNKTETGAKANYVAAQVVAAAKHGALRPQLALNLMPARIYRNFSSDPDYTYDGFASSLTFALMFVGERAMIGPYVTGTNFYSDRFDNVGWFASAGLYFALRPDRNRPPPRPVPTYTPGPPGVTPP